MITMLVVFYLSQIEAKYFENDFQFYETESFFLQRGRISIYHV